MISLVPDEEQSEFALSVRDFLAKRLPLSRVRELAATPDGIDDALWNGYAELGWLAVGTPEDFGGVGLGIIDEVLMLVEAGRFLAPGPLRSTLLAARIAADAGDTALVDALISGQRRAGLAVGGVAVDARIGDLVVELDDDATRIVELREGDAVDAVDPSTRLRRMDAVHPLVVVDRSYLTHGRVLAAAELLGVLEAVRDESAAYARTRVQFGKAIGSFQAVKHRCADMAVASYAVRAQVAFAAIHLDAGESTADLQADMAFVLARDLTRDSAKNNILNHGGIGFTWEADPHLRLKRAVLLGQLFGTERQVAQCILAAEHAA